MVGGLSTKYEKGSRLTTMGIEIREWGYALPFLPS
jgi:hypothetical protein